MDKANGVASVNEKNLCKYIINLSWNIWKLWEIEREKKIVESFEYAHVFEETGAYKHTNKSSEF